MIVDQLYTQPKPTVNSTRIFTEGRHKKLLKEDAVFRQARQFGQLLVEYNLTKAQVQQLFKDVEQGATAAGNNRTGLGKAKDFTGKAIGSVQNMLASARKWVKDRPTYQAVDAEYNRAMTALGKAGGENGEANAITKAIYKYRDAAKNYPRAAGLAKWAIITAAGFATGGLGGTGVAAGLAAIDSALKDREIVDIVGDAGIAALVSGAVQGAGDLASAASDAYNGVPSAADIAANNAALGNWNDTDIPGGPASNINGLDLPPDQVAGLTTDGTPNIVGPEAEGLTPEELANAAAQAKAYGFDGDVTLDQLNQAIMQTAEPGTVPADYSQLGAGGGTTDYTAVKGDTLSKIAEKNGVSVKELADANGIDYKDVHNIKAGQTLKIPGETGSAVYDQGVGAGGPGPGPGPNDTVTPPAVTTQPAVQFTNGNEGTLTLPDGRELRAIAFPPEGIQPRITGEPVTVTYGGQSVKAYIKGDIAYFTRFDPNAGLGLQESWLPAVKLLKLPAAQLIDHKLTVMGWALNESTNREMGRSLQLTKLGVRTVFENIGRYRREYLKEYVGAPTADYGHPTAPGAPASATAGQGKPQGWFGRGLDTIGRGVDKVGSWASNVGHNVITKVTADKLSNMWNRAGEPYDSDQLYQLLTTKWGVPQQAVDSVFSKMGIPFTAVAGSQAGGSGIQTGATSLIDPETGRPYEKSKLAAYRNPVAGATPAATKTHTGGRVAGAGLSMTPNAIRKRDARTAAATTASGAAGAGAFGQMASQLAGKQPNTMANTTVSKTNTAKPGNPNNAGAGAFGQMASQLAGKQPNTMANTTVSKTNTAKPGNPNNAGAGAFGQMGTQLAKGGTTAPVANFGNTNFSSYKQPGASTTAPSTTSFKPTSTAPVAPGNQKLTPDEYIKRIGAPATAETIKQVKKMLETMQTRDDVNFIKKYINHEFDRQGLVNELATAQRNHLIERVTQIAAVRRRDHAKLLA